MCTSFIIVIFHNRASFGSKYVLLEIHAKEVHPQTQKNACFWYTLVVIKSSSNKHLAVVEALADGLHELIDGQLLLPVSGQAIHELVEQLRADRLPDSADLVGLKLK